MSINPSWPVFRETEIQSAITEFAVALAAQHNGTWHPSGTGIIIAPGVALTAKHVFEDYWKQFEVGWNKTHGTRSSFAMLARQYVDEGKFMAGWEVKKVWYSNATDIAILLLRPVSKHASIQRCRRVMLQLMPPAIGSRVAAFGYRASEISNIRETLSSVEITWTDIPTTAAGDVIDVYPIRRDAGMLTFPCFCVNALLEGGMSGGPVFNEKGQLCGLVCSSMRSHDTETPHRSFVSTLWPLLATEVEVDQNGREVKCPMLDLVKSGFIAAENWERICISKNSEGQISGISITGDPQKV